MQPDLILLDIGLPTLNGIEAAKRIHQVSPRSKILFVSENRSLDTAEEALSTGAGGYILKSDAASELWPAVKALLEGKRCGRTESRDSGSSPPGFRSSAGGSSASVRGFPPDASAPGRFARGGRTSTSVRGSCSRDGPRAS